MRYQMNTEGANESEPETKIGLVAFADVLGVSNFSSLDTNECRIECKSLIVKIEQLAKKFESTFCAFMGEIPLILYRKDIKLEYRFFNDTLIFTLGFENDLPDEHLFYSVINFCRAANGLIFNSFRFGINMPGVISFGEYYVSENMIIGPAVFDANKWYKRLNISTWILTPSLKERMSKIVLDMESENPNNNHLNYFKGLLLNYKVPLKPKGTNDKEQNVRESLCLGWPLSYLIGGSSYDEFVTQFNNCKPNPKDREVMYDSTCAFFKEYECNGLPYYLAYQDKSRKNKSSN